MKLVIIDYGAGNTKSVQFAIERLGYVAIVSNDISVIQSADKVVFPGVGEASFAMRNLKKSGLDKLIPSLTQPVLGICLGMQLMCKFSEENATEGLGIFDVDVKRFSTNVKVPQMGWNTIFKLSSPLFRNIKEDDYMYLVHSFYVESCAYQIATTTYDVNYASALQKDNFYGVQFHPEKSSTSGEQLLKNFIEL
ncbi:MAG: imidazole glycerol phosphate synthase subunit HisH [Flavobacteriaceae bacterium]|mgnify:CR=1 FL=1